jgi:hypothetical protein
MHSLNRYGRIFGLAAILDSRGIARLAQYSARRDEVVQLEDTKAQDCYLHFAFRR